MAEAKLSKLERLQKRKEEIEKQLKALEARDKQAARKKDARQKIIVGAAVLAHAKIDENFAKTLREVLKKAVTEERNLAVIADLFAEATPEQKPEGQP